MSQLLEQLRNTFADEEYRYSYVDSFMNSYIAAQIKLLREESGLSHDELAQKVGATRTGIARLEDVGYSAWKVDMLRKIARALGVRLKVGFEEFGSLPGEIDGFKREALLRVPFDEDPVFSRVAPSASAAEIDALRQEQIPEEDFARETRKTWTDAVMETGAATPPC
jgi:transcriptional regulator with XRE-family HTH domain